MPSNVGGGLAGDFDEVRDSDRQEIISRKYECVGLSLLRRLWENKGTIMGGVTRMALFGPQCCSPCATESIGFSTSADPGATTQRVAD